MCTQYTYLAKTTTPTDNILRKTETERLGLRLRGHATTASTSNCSGQDSDEEKGVKAQDTLENGTPRLKSEIYFPYYDPHRRNSDRVSDDDRSRKGELDMEVCIV